MIEYNYCKREVRRFEDEISDKNTDEKDDDVAAEEKRVSKIIDGEIETETITVH
jgi:hypothetical protein